jgi:hypothetical protein
MQKTQKTELQAEWVSVPDACTVVGIGRSSFYAHLNSGKIRTVSLKRPGTTKGRRLIHLASLLGYLELLAIKQGGNIDASRA